MGDAGIVVQDVDAPAVIEDRLGQRLDLFRPGHVDRVIDRAAADLAGHRGGCVTVDVCDMHLGAVPGKQPRGRCADPRSGTGHDRGLAGQVDVFGHGDSYLLMVGFAGPE